MREIEKESGRDREREWKRWGKRNRMGNIEKESGRDGERETEWEI
jgi:hypothetical protein